MAVPKNVVFDRFAVLTQGILSVLSNLPLLIGIDDVALVTALIAAGAFGNWSVCAGSNACNWTMIGTNATTWTPVSTFSTIWTPSPFGV